MAKKTLVSSKNTPTAAGQKASKPAPTESVPTGPKSAEEREQTINAINQMFAEFELVYHNQYNKAFSTQEKQEWAKKLWYSNLKEYSAQQILSAAQRAIKESEYLPTVRGVLKYIENQYREQGLPEPREAYIEACQAPSPKVAHEWSHPAVYYAGLESDWFFLASNTEQMAFPVFEKHYRQLCEDILKGQQLSMPTYEALPETTNEVMSKEARLKALAKLRKETGF